MFRNLFPAQPDMAGLLQSMPKGQQTSQLNPVNMLGALSQLTQLPSMPKPPEFRGSGNVSLGGGRPDPAAAKSAEQQKEQAGLQAGLSELGKLKEESGKPTLTLDQMVGTLAKNMPADRAVQIGRLMFNEQQTLVDKNKLTTIYEKIDQGGKLTTEEKALVGYKEDKKEQPKNKVVDYFMPDNQGGYTKESVQIPEDAYNDTIKQIRSSGGFLRDRTEKKEKQEPTIWEAFTPMDKDKFISKYEAAGPEELKWQGIFNVEDYVYQTGRLQKPKDYTLIPELATKINSDGKYSEEKAMAMAEKARKYFGTTDTYNKWKDYASELVKDKEASTAKKQAEVDKAKAAKVEAKKPKEAPSGAPVTMTEEGSLWNKTTSRRIMTPQKMVTQLGEFKKKNPKYLEYIELQKKYGFIDDAEYNQKKKEYDELKLQSIFNKRR